MILVISGGSRRPLGGGGCPCRCQRRSLDAQTNQSPREGDDDDGGGGDVGDGGDDEGPSRAPNIHRIC